MIPSGLLSACLLILSACSLQQTAFSSANAAEDPSPEVRRSDTAVPTDTSVPTLTHTASPTSTETATPTTTSTPNATPSPTITLTPTPDVPVVKALMRSFCRYGPGKAYLYSHELKEGEVAVIDGRNASSSWLWVQPENLDRHCWVSSAVVETQGDVNSLNVVQTRLPHSTLYGSPVEVETARDGDWVLIAWEPVWMTQDDDRGYLIEASVCQNGSRVWLSAQTDEPHYEVNDEGGCSGESGGKLYTVEKHGYTDPVEIPWP